jgi:hypothetical protein
MQLSDIVHLEKPRRLLAEARKWYRSSFGRESFRQVDSAFALTADLYSGRYPGYRKCEVAYHDYQHTLAVFSASARLVDGCSLCGKPLEAEVAADTLVAALFHDVGYLQESHDAGGTGAQYTRTHVDRSAAFVRRHAADFGIGASRAARIERFILGTDLSRRWDELELQGDGECRAAAVLAAADLLGQMADRAYLERLLFLYYEFKEAEIEGYSTAFDILRKTAAFYETVKARLDGTLAEVSHVVSFHFARRYGTDRDLYREAIDRQMAYLDSILADDTVNFRKKLRRLALETIEKGRESG